MDPDWRGGPGGREWGPPDGHHHDHYRGHHHGHGHHWEHADGDGGWFFPWLPGLLTLLLALWLLHRTYGLDVLAARARAALTDSVRPRWEEAVRRHGKAAQAYGAFECDPGEVLRRPALADVTEAATARFVDAFAEASALVTDAYPGPEHAERFIRAAERAEKAWTAAVAAADRVRVARFAPGERALVEQVLALLSLATSSPHEAERRSAYQRARHRLRDLERRTGWTMPRPATAELESRARGMLAVSRP